MSSTVVLGTGAVMPPQTFKDKLDIVYNMYDQQPQSLVKTLRYTAEWARIFFSTLSTSIPFMKFITVLTHGDDIFNLSDATTDFNTLRKKVVDYFYTTNVTIGQLFIAHADFINKICEVSKWLCSFNIISLSSSLLFKASLIGGVTMMIGFGSRAVDLFFSKVPTAQPLQKSYLMWETAKHTSLFAIGVFSTLGCLFTISPIFLLISGTSALISNYGTNLAKNSQTTISKERVTHNCSQWDRYASQNNVAVNYIQAS
jgi:hypothetical protein